MRSIQTLAGTFRRPRASVFGLIVALMACASFAWAAPPEDAGAILGKAPIRFESQDPGDAQQRTLGPSLLQASSSPTRAQVAQLYYGVYIPTGLVPLQWSGSIAGCQPGDTNIALQQAVIDRVNYFRALAGLPGVTLIGGTPHVQVQAAALMMSANGDLSHSPPPGWTCYSANGAAGAGSSNLALGATATGAIDLYMVDPGTGNAEAGHRRWILFPPRSTMATGDVPASGGSWAANSLYVFGATTTRPATPNGVAWPPAGYVPYQNLPASSNRWSFSYPAANFSTATISMLGPQGNVVVQQSFPVDGFGDNTIVFEPFGLPYGQPLADTTYTITVSGMTGGGVPPSIQYTVTVFDPATASPPSASTNYVQKSYVAYYGRPADPAGLAYWVARMDAEGGSLSSIIAAFGNSNEFNTRYGGLTNTQLVTKIYQQALGRNPDAGGLAYYVGEIVAGRKTLQTITLDILNGATTPPDSTVVANRLDVASYYTADVAAGCPYGTEQDGVAILSGVTADPATVASAKAQIDARCGP